MDAFNENTSSLQDEKQNYKKCDFKKEITVNCYKYEAMF